MREPERASVAPKLNYTMPTIVRVPGVKFKTHGKYRTKTGNAKGLVVHYTVSGRTAKNARGVLAYLAKNGLGCMVMDEDGIIYIPENFNLQTDVAYHAGKSSWKGLSGMSYYCMGMEMCCWGKGSKVGPFRVIKKQTDNRKVGTYQAYTAAQEKSLENFVLWQLDVNPEFDINFVAGHDEIAPLRKSDPGGSLSVGMPAFRGKFK